MGWVSLFDPSEVAQLLHLPPGAEPIALLCLGPVQSFYKRPMLEEEQWAMREALTATVFDDCWGAPTSLAPALRSV
jgi:5,6-dimethylbenzimidazole synthase